MAAEAVQTAAGKHLTVYARTFEYISCMFKSSCIRLSYRKHNASHTPTLAAAMSQPIPFSDPVARIAVLSGLIAKTKGHHRVLELMRQQAASFSANGTSTALYNLGRDAEVAANLTRYDSQSGQAVPAITDKNLRAELEAVTLLGCLCGPSWANGSSPETFRETLSDACILIDSTSYNDQPR